MPQNTATDPPPTVEIDEINPDDFIISNGVQIRIATKKNPNGLDSERIEQYAKDMIAGDKFPNIQAVRSNAEPDKFIVFDGFNRLAALKRAHVILENSFNQEGWNGITKQPTLKATIHEGKFSVQRLRFMAFKANKAHGLALTFKERKEGFTAFIKAKLFFTSFNRVMSLSQIGREFGISKQAVAGRLMGDHRRIYEAYYSKEGEAARWKGGLKRYSANDIDDGEQTAMNLATYNRTHYEQMFRAVDNGLHLGLIEPAWAAQFREQLAKEKAELTAKLAAIGITDQQPDF